MNQLAASALALAVVTAVLGACDGRDHRRFDHAIADDCAQFASCGACTPIVGCGWCYNADGTGMCAADPDECATPAFSWTWDPSGCRSAADAAVLPAAIDASSSPDASDAARTAAYPPDAASVVQDAQLTGDASPASAADSAPIH